MFLNCFNLKINPSKKPPKIIPIKNAKPSNLTINPPAQDVSGKRGIWRKFPQCFWASKNLNHSPVSKNWMKLTTKKHPKWSYWRYSIIIFLDIKSSLDLRTTKYKPLGNSEILIAYAFCFINSVFLYIVLPK